MSQSCEHGNKEDGITSPFNIDEVANVTTTDFEWDSSEDAATEHFEYYDKQELGRGSYGTVYLATHRKTNQQFAIKERFDELTRDKDSLKEEYSFLQQIKHPHIVKVYGTFLGKQSTQIVMELMPRGSILTVLAKNRFRLHEAQIRRYAYGALEGLKYMHAEPRRFVHRDIKPGNLLVSSDDQVKLADLGCTTVGAVHTTQCFSTSKGMVGTLAYLAPECSMSQPEYSPHTDLWALGCTIIEMASGQAHWLEDAKKDDRLKDRLEGGGIPLMFGLMGLLRSGKWSPRIPTHLSVELKQLLGRMFCLESPQSRGVCADYLKDPYFSSLQEDGTGEELPASAESVEAYESARSARHKEIRIEHDRAMSSQGGSTGTGVMSGEMRSHAATRTASATGLWDFTFED